MKYQILESLFEVIKDRKKNPNNTSYTSNFFLTGTNKIVKKLGEENAEYIQAFLKEDDSEVAMEAADYIYHLLVSLVYRDIEFEKVLSILEERHKK